MWEVIILIILTQIFNIITDHIFLILNFFFLLERVALQGGGREGSGLSDRGREGKKEGGREEGREGGKERERNELREGGKYIGWERGEEREGGREGERGRKEERERGSRKG